MIANAIKVYFLARAFFDFMLCAFQVIIWEHYLNYSAAKITATVFFRQRRFLFISSDKSIGKNAHSSHSINSIKRIIHL